MNRRRLTLALCAVASATSCGSCNTGQLQNHPAFQLTYIDQGNQVRVRYSDDGVTWTDGGFSASATTGAGASSSPDVAGVTRVVAEGGVGNLRLWFGLGPSNWSSTPVPLSTLHPRSRPTIVDVGQSRFLIAFLPASGAAFELWMYDHGARTTTQVPVSSGYGNADVHFSPAMSFLPADPAAGRNTDRVALSWGRYSSASADEPFEIRTLVAHIAATGSVTVSGGFWKIVSDSLDSNTYQGPIPHLLSEPSLTNDHTKFILASHQRFFGIQPTTRLSEYVEMHHSSDGVTWQDNSFLQNTGGVSWTVPAHVEFAVQPNCTAVLILVPRTTSSIHAQLHLPNGNNQGLTNSAVFGSNLPAQRQFSLMATGRPASFPSFGCTHF